MVHQVILYIEQPFFVQMGKLGPRGVKELAQVHSNKRRQEMGSTPRQSPSVLTPREVKDEQRKEKGAELRWKSWGNEKRTKCEQHRGGDSRWRRRERVQMQGGGEMEGWGEDDEGRMLEGRAGWGKREGR